MRSDTFDQLVQCAKFFLEKNFLLQDATYYKRVLQISLREQCSSEPYLHILDFESRDDPLIYFMCH